MAIEAATGRVTVHDLARAAGVSLATVDRVLNGRPGVRPATQTRVEDAIAQIGFRRDMTASMLARARDIRIAFILAATAVGATSSRSATSAAAALLRPRWAPGIGNWNSPSGAPSR